MKNIMQPSTNWQFQSVCNIAHTL
uniref:Uncharacterized protein n=1 Tax=Arundo donax TaxID=35708 RepID=A0A0A8YJ30_ARUDO